MKKEENMKIPNEIWYLLISKKHSLLLKMQCNDCLLCVLTCQTPAQDPVQESTEAPAEAEGAVEEASTPAPEAAENQGMNALDYNKHVFHFLNILPIFSNKVYFPFLLSVI